ncbi:MAG TPA: hypothetical protein VFW38_02755 [Solirubrobacteraceae bacterium]|nr:hypothetical protein [Solirubrobacteraceae bacterium]
MSKASNRELSQQAERELAALADGSLADERRRQALARVHDSPQLQAELATQQRAVELLATAEETAPAALHERIGAMAAAQAQSDGLSTGRSAAVAAWRGRMRSRRQSRPAIAFAGATVLAGVVGIAIALSSSGQKTRQQSSPALSAAATTALTLRAATLPAPGESGHDHQQLAAAVGGVAFPYWKERFGWRGSGARTDTLAGRAVTTVFYSNSAGQRIGYAIVAGPAPASGGGSVVRRWGVAYRLSSREGVNAIVWRRDGHLCVIAGRGVSPQTLLSLASWGSARPRAA